MRKNISSLMTSKNILIALTVLCCFFIGTSFFTDTLTKPLKKCVSMVVVPVQKGMNNIGFWVYDKYQTLQEISVVLDENKKLQSQVDDLTEENNQLKQDSYELNRLRDLYELDQQYAGYSKVGARVIEVTTDNWHSSFKIDKGTDDGLKVNMNVIASGGLVGIISETGSNYSIVKTITENNKSKFSYLVSSIFPPKSEMQYKYPYVKKTPFLLPISWCHMWGKRLFVDRDINFKSGIKNRMSYTDEDVKLYKSLLDEMGFDGIGINNFGN